MIGLLSGIAFGVAAIFLVRRLGNNTALFAFALLVLPIIYVWFALLDNSGANASRELLAGLPWIVGGVVLLGYRVPHATAIVGALWILHGVYDVVHDQLFTNPGVPDWYPLACLGTDAVVGGYLLFVAYREKDARVAV